MTYISITFFKSLFGKNEWSLRQICFSEYDHPRHNLVYFICFNSVSPCCSLVANNLNGTMMAWNQQSLPACRVDIMSLSAFCDWYHIMLLDYWANRCALRNQFYHHFKLLLAVPCLPSVTIWQWESKYSNISHCPCDRYMYCKVGNSSFYHTAQGILFIWRHFQRLWIQYHIFHPLYAQGNIFYSISSLKWMKI